MFKIIILNTFDFRVPSCRLVECIQSIRIIIAVNIVLRLIKSLIFIMCNLVLFFIRNIINNYSYNMFIRI